MKRIPLLSLGIPVLAAGIAALAAGNARGDCGSIPFDKPLMVNSFEVVNSGNAGMVGVDSTGGKHPKTIQFDPLKVSVFEPQQRALILWNGREEILLLSTDQKATEKSAVLEVIPLPAEPQIRLGSFKTFEKAQKLMVEKRLWACAHGGAKAGAATLPENAARITFQKRMGAHDLTVATVLDKEGFVEFVQRYLREKYKTPDAPIRPEFVSIIQSYLDKGFRWFAFDVIELGDSVQTRQPIEYRFASDEVFYPLRISTLERGDTQVDLLVFSPNRTASFTGLSSDRIRKQPVVDVSVQEVEGLEDGWKGFFGAVAPPMSGTTAGSTGAVPVSNPAPHPLVLHQWTIEGDIATFTQDVKAR